MDVVIRTWLVQDTYNAHVYLPRPAYLRQSGGGGAGRGGGGEGDGAVPRPRQPSHHLLPLGLQQLGQQRECRDKLGI